MKLTSHKIFVTVIVAVVAIVAGYGLYLSGSPTLERQRRLDGQRVSDLQQITTAMDTYWAQKHNLPPSLEELERTRDVYLSSIRDPETQTLYEYRPVTGSGDYELCAVFTIASETDPAKTVPYGPEASRFWSHGIGRACFSLQVRNPQKEIRL